MKTKKKNQKTAKKPVDQDLDDDDFELETDENQEEDEDFEPKKKQKGGSRPGAGRPTGAKGVNAPPKITSEIRKMAYEDGDIPLKYLLHAAMRGSLQRKGKTRRILTVQEQLACLTSVMPYMHPKLVPVSESDEDNRSPFLKLFDKEKVAALSTLEIQLLERVLATLSGESKRELPLLEAKAVPVEEKEPKKGKKGKITSYEDLV